MCSRPEESVGSMCVWWWRTPEFFYQKTRPGISELCNEPSSATSERCFGILVTKLAAEMPFESDD